ncbi:MAG TPA: GYF domain-containing protein [Candidatus Methylacidiphilales bacterium]|jgi:uncharacterized membrane protein|nr:GYF domain-containing protein [Candidatus Methylacidiphilales bacterium]
MSDWYYAANNEQKGPVNESELKGNLASGKIPADTLVWKDGMDNWTPANQVAAFTFRPAPAPAAVQPPAETAPATKAAESTQPVDLTKLVGPGEALEVDAEDAEKNKIFGILAYLGVLCLVPLVMAKDSPYAKYHANQGLVLFLVEIASGIITFAGILLPFVGFVFYILHVILYLVFLVLVVLGIINAAAGKCVPLPVIGGIKLLK